MIVFTDLPPTLLLQGEGLEKPILALLLPFRMGEGGWEGKVCRTDVETEFPFVGAYSHPSL